MKLNKTETAILAQIKEGSLGVFVSEASYCGKKTEGVRESQACKKLEEKGFLKLINHSVSQGTLYSGRGYTTVLRYYTVIQQEVI